MAGLHSSAGCYGVSSRCALHKQQTVTANSLRSEGQAAAIQCALIRTFPQLISIYLNIFYTTATIVFKDQSELNSPPPVNTVSFFILRKYLNLLYSIIRKRISFHPVQSTLSGLTQA